MLQNYPTTQRQFKYYTRHRASIHKCCTNCSILFSDECNRDPEEWIRATKEGTCGKCHEEITDHLSGDSDI